MSISLKDVESKNAPCARLCVPVEPEMRPIQGGPDMRQVAEMVEVAEMAAAARGAEA